MTTKKKPTRKKTTSQALQDAKSTFKRDSEDTRYRIGLVADRLSRFEERVVKTAEAQNKAIGRFAPHEEQVLNHARAVDERLVQFESQLASLEARLITVEAPRLTMPGLVELFAARLDLLEARVEQKSGRRTLVGRCTGFVRQLAREF